MSEFFTAIWSDKRVKCTSDIVKSFIGKPLKHGNLIIGEVIGAELTEDNSIKYTVKRF